MDKIKKIFRTEDKPICSVCRKVAAGASVVVSDAGTWSLGDCCRSIACFASLHTLLLGVTMEAPALEVRR